MNLKQKQDEYASLLRRHKYGPPLTQAKLHLLKLLENQLSPAPTRAGTKENKK